MLAGASFVLPLEVALRVFPQAISYGLLREFEPSVRARIAARRSLPKLSDTVTLPRDDGGPDKTMWIYKPLTDVTLDFDEPGIVKTVRTDKMGFCNPSADAYDVAKIDVAAIGDSFTWCTSVEPAATWPYRLSGRTGRSTYNFGLPGRGLYEYLQILTRFAVAKSPDVVVVNIYEGNDLRDAVRYHEARVDAGGPDVQRPCPYSSEFLCATHERLATAALARHSYVYNLLLAAVWRLAYESRQSEIDFQYSVELADGTRVAFNSGNRDRDEVGNAAAVHDGVFGPDLFDEGLQRFMALSRTHHFAPVVLYTPSAYSAYVDTARFDDPAIAESLRFFSETQREYFSRKARDLGYHFVDATDALRQAARRQPPEGLLYFRSNVHLTPAGHEVVARALESTLESLPANDLTATRSAP